MEPDPQQPPPPDWYPDPSGRGPGQRFWNGARWTAEVRPVPGAPVRGRPWLIPVVAIGVVLVLLGAGLFALGLTRRTAAPVSTAATPTTLASATEAAPPQPTIDPAMCQVGDPNYRGSDPGDGRLHGGGLVMATPQDWSTADPSRLAFAFDVGLIESPAADGWAALGAVRIESPYGTPEQASATITACLKELTDSDTVRVTDSGSTTVRGADRAHERSGTLQTGGRTQDFLVVVTDLLSPESLAFYVRVIDPASDQYQSLTAAESGLGRA